MDAVRPHINIVVVGNVFSLPAHIVSHVAMLYCSFLGSKLPLTF
jgi:hypothetical protein